MFWRQIFIILLSQISGCTTVGLKTEAENASMLPRREPESDNTGIPGLVVPAERTTPIAQVQPSSHYGN